MDINKLYIVLMCVQLLESELINHESQFELVCTRAQELISSSHFGSEDVVMKKRALQNSWEELKALSAEHNEKLNDSLQAHQVRMYCILCTYIHLHMCKILYFDCCAS